MQELLEKIYDLDSEKGVKSDVRVEFEIIPRDGKFDFGFIVQDEKRFAYCVRRGDPYKISADEAEELFLDMRKRAIENFMKKEIREGNVLNIIKTNSDLYGVMKFLADKVGEGYKDFQVHKVTNLDANKIVDTVVVDFKNVEKRMWKYLWLGLNDDGNA